MGGRLERGKFPDLELAGCGFFRTPRKVKTELSVVGYFRLCWLMQEIVWNVKPVLPD